MLLIVRLLPIVRWRVLVNLNALFGLLGFYIRVYAD